MQQMNLTGNNPAPATSAPAYYQAEKIGLEQKIRRHTNWFYWIAGLSLINTIISMTGTNWAFSVGLGLTQVFDYFAQQLEGPLKAIPLFISFLAIAVFALFGYLAGKAHLWAIVTGFVIYLLDGLLLLALMVLGGGGGAILSLIIHGLALYSIFNGMTACRRLKALEAEAAAMPPPPPSFNVTRVI